MATITMNSTQTVIELTTADLIGAIAPIVTGLGATMPDFEEGEADNVYMQITDAAGTTVHVDQTTPGPHQLIITDEE